MEGPCALPLIPYNNMACNITLADIAYSCDDLGVGGIVALHIANQSDAVAALTLDAANRAVTTAAAVTGVAQISFNNKDGFSVFSEVKTVNADGTSSTVPTVSVELPKMTATKITELNNIAKAGAELVAFVETAAGTYHAVGLDYGLYASTVDGNSGTGRAEKNRFQLTLTGEENGLSYSIADATDFATITA